MSKIIYPKLGQIVNLQVCDTVKEWFMVLHNRKGVMVINVFQDGTFIGYSLEHRKELVICPGEWKERDESYKSNIDLPEQEFFERQKARFLQKKKTKK